MQDSTYSRVAWPRKINQIPKDVFYREDVFSMELERIFCGPEWHPVAQIAEVERPGDFKTTFIGKMPVLVVHGEDGRVRVFENSCPHRGTQLKVNFRGALGKSIECPYHRWSFATTGALQGAPGISDFPPCFRKEDYGLRELRSQAIAGVHFATASQETPDLAVYLGEVAPYLHRILGETGDLNFLGTQKALFSSNWKEYSDNEGYHAPLLHGAFRLLGWGSGKGVQLMTDRAHKVIHATHKDPSNSTFLSDMSLVQGRNPNEAAQSVVVSLFPTTLMVKHLDVISIRYAFPLSPNETEVHYTYFAEKSDSPELAQHRLRQASNLLGPSGLISLEDGAVFNRLHVGARTPGTVEFQKGVRDVYAMPDKLQQNDEAGNLVRWERYRDLMGFDRG